MLGLDVMDGVLQSAPHIPPALGRLRLEGILVRGRRQSAE
jgi:hypothetical protein